MANTKWPFKGLAVGDTVTIYGHPPARVSAAAKSYAYGSGTKFRTRKTKLLNGNVCVVVTRLTDDGFHPDPARDVEGPGPLFARKGHLPPDYAGPWPWEALKAGQKVVYDARVYSQAFLRAIKPRAHAKGYKVVLTYASGGTEAIVTAAVTRVTRQKPVSAKVAEKVTP